jgi:hypothetical protein
LYTLRETLAEGGKATLTTGAIAGRDVVPTDLPNAGRLMHLIDHQPDGTYLAVLQHSPFVNGGMRGIVERGSFHLVIGWPEGQP